MCKTTQAIALLRKQKNNPDFPSSFVLRVVENLLVEALTENQPKTASLSHDRLLEVMAYDPKTGHFYWRHGHRRGLRAGTIAYGYRLIVIDQVTYRASRLAWFYVYGVWPEYEADHKNKIKDDNRIKNLRDLTGSENQRNREFNNPWGCPGVTKTASGRFTVRFRVDGKDMRFGTYDDQYDAVKVCKAQRKAHGVELG